MTRTFFDLMGGIGGIRLGLERAGWKCVGYSEIDKYCRRTYDANFDRSKEWSWDDATTLPVEQMPDFDLLACGFPCFGEGTLVLTAQGYRPIQDVAVGDLVLTHLGRWRSVLATSRRESSSLRIIEAGGARIVTTDEHPFWARAKYWTWNPNLRQAIRMFEAPIWTRAASLSPKKDFLGQAMPRETATDGHSQDFWWLIGRYLADGWRVKRKSRVRGGRVIICGDKSERPELLRRIALAGFAATAVDERTGVKCHITRNALYDFLEPFGHRAFGKTIPGFALELPKEKAAALLAGYLSGDGFKHGEVWTASTTSRALALGIVLLAQKTLGVIGRINQTKVPRTTVIEGRTVSQRDFWTIQIPPRNRESFVEGSVGWRPCTHNYPLEGGEFVLNLEVEEDNSYIVENIMVHNCQPWSNAGKRQGFDDARGTLFFDIARVLKGRSPKAFLLENVKGLLSEPMRPSYTRMMATLRQLGYAVSVRVLNSRDFGVPQNRERVFFAGFKGRGFQDSEFAWPAPRPRTASLNDILEPNPDPKYNLSQRLVKTLLGHLARNRLSGKGAGWGITLLSRNSEYAPPVPESYWRGPGGAGRAGVVSPPVMDNYARGMTALMLDTLNLNKDQRVFDGPDMRAVTTRAGRSLGIAVNTTNPHDGEEQREYHASGEMRTLSAESSGTNAPLVLQIKRYHADGQHEIRDYSDSPTLTEQMGKGGDNVPIMVQLVSDKDDQRDAFTLAANPDSDRNQALILRASSAMSEIGRDRVRLVREDAPSLMSGGDSGWAGYANALAVALKGPDKIGVSKDAQSVTAAGSRSQLGAVQGMRIRRLTPRECARLQGFPETFAIPVSDHQAYREFGNTITVPVVEAIGRAMLKRLQKA